VADVGRVAIALPPIDALAVLADPGSLFVAGALFLGMFELIETLGFVWAGAGAAIVGALVMSSSFNLFANGSES
jgi:hypothetical protein